MGRGSGGRSKRNGVGGMLSSLDGCSGVSGRSDLSISLICSFEYVGRTKLDVVDSSVSPSACGAAGAKASTLGGESEGVIGNITFLEIWTAQALGRMYKYPFVESDRPTNLAFCERVPVLLIFESGWINT